MCEKGFTLIELAVVLLIIAVMTALAVPGVSRYRMTEQTREGSQAVAIAVRQARAAALKDAVQHFVIFNPAAPPSAVGTIVRVVRDVDGDWQETAADLGTDYGFRPATHADITPYGMGPQTPYSDYAPAPGDPGGATLATVTEGASFPADPITGRPAVGFTAQGVAVDLNTPTGWGTGAGAFYVTDNSAVVYATVVGPLGEVRVRALNPGTGEWQ
jgi:prepilin-type N-terminal cleavage/methylation domain-containing protein